MIKIQGLEKKWLDYIPNMVKDESGHHQEGYRIILFPHDAIAPITIAIADTELEAKVLTRTTIGSFNAIIETANEVMV